MTTQMIFAFTYVPCVACVGMAYAFGGSIGKFLKLISFIFGLTAIISYISFIRFIW